MAALHTASPTSPLTTERADTGKRVFWRGHELGFLQYCGSGFLAGQLSYHGEVFDTDLYGDPGIPPHWLTDKVEPWCVAIDQRAAAALQAAE